jgi:hypothetical protein
MNIVEQKLRHLHDLIEPGCQITVHSVEDEADPDFFCCHPRSDPEEGFSGKTLEEAVDNAIAYEENREKHEASQWN